MSTEWTVKKSTNLLLQKFLSDSVNMERPWEQLVRIKGKEVVMFQKCQGVLKKKK